MVGKTSLFTILTGVHEAARVGSLEARVGVTKVPDARLDALAKIFDPPKITFATVEYLDFPAISKESLRDPKYLASLRVVDALAHVLRVFESDTVPHESGSVDPVRDFEDVEMELILSDLVVVEKRMERVQKELKRGKNVEFEKELELLQRIKTELEANRAVRTLDFSDEDEKRLRGFQFLSQKPMLCVLNLGEEDAARMAEVEEKYRTGPFVGRKRNRGHGDLRKDRGGAGGATERRRARVPEKLWPARIRARTPDRRNLFAIRPDVVPDSRRN